MLRRWTVQQKLPLKEMKAVERLPFPCPVYTEAPGEKGGKLGRPPLYLRPYDLHYPQKETYVERKGQKA